MGCNLTCPSPKKSVITLALIWKQKRPREQKSQVIRDFLPGRPLLEIWGRWSDFPTPWLAHSRLKVHTLTNRELLLCFSWCRREKRIRPSRSTRSGPWAFCSASEPSAPCPPRRWSSSAVRWAMSPINHRSPRRGRQPPPSTKVSPIFLSRCGLLRRFAQFKEKWPSVNTLWEEVYWCMWLYGAFDSLPSSLRQTHSLYLIACGTFLYWAPILINFIEFYSLQEGKRAILGMKTTFQLIYVPKSHCFVQSFIMLSIYVRWITMKNVLNQIIFQNHSVVFLSVFLELFQLAQFKKHSYSFFTKRRMHILQLITT